MEETSRYQSITFSISNYLFNIKVEEARKLMWADIAQLLRLLTKNGYIAVVYDDDTDIIVIQYEHYDRDGDWGVSNPRWLTEDEYWNAISESADDSLDDDEEQ